MLIQYPKRLKKRYKKINKLNNETLKEIFIAYKENKLRREAIFEIMKQMLIDGKFEFPSPCSEIELMETLKKSKEKLKEIKIINENKKEHILMGLIMNQLRGRVDGSLVENRIKMEKWV